MKWHNCEDCDAEFRVISDTSKHVFYCPFCATELVTEDDEDESEEDLNDYED